jgi:hypothetical protein
MMFAAGPGPCTNRVADLGLKHSPAEGSIHQSGIRITLRAGVSGGKLMTDPGTTENLLFQVLTYTHQQ